MTVTIITNNVPRDILDAFDLTKAEIKEFGYLDWPRIDRGEDSASFVRYRGEIYDLGEFQVWDNPSSPTRLGWDAFMSDSFFSGLVVKYVTEDDFTYGERVVIGRYYS